VKKSFNEFTTLKKTSNGLVTFVTEELLWRFGEVSVSFTNEELKKYCDDNDLDVKAFNGCEDKIFNYLKDEDDILCFNGNFPFEFEFLSSNDSCYSEYTIDCGDDKEFELKIRDIIDEEGLYVLEDDYGYIVYETKWEIYGELDIKKI